MLLFDEQDTFGRHIPYLRNILSYSFTIIIIVRSILIQNYKRKHLTWL